MFERLVENWLTEANERLYQFPFCQILVSQGYRILYISSHGPQEQGKDIIALDPHGRAVAYQLKGGNIDLALWRQIRGEVEELLDLPIHFPGVPAHARHRSVLVTNGQLKDTVRREIDDRNILRRKQRKPILQVVVKDDLLRQFLDVHARFFPQEPSQLRDLLRLSVSEGTAPLPREQLAAFIQGNLPLAPAKSGESIRPSDTPSPLVVSRQLASVALLAHYALTAFTESNNHLALFEGWVIVASHILAVAERRRLPDRAWKATFDLATNAAHRALSCLVTESLERHKNGTLLEGERLVDSIVYKSRLTILAGLLALYECVSILHHNTRRNSEAVSGFISSALGNLHFWGESAVPYFLFLGWYFQATGRPLEGEAVWAQVIREVLKANRPRSEGDDGSGALPDPYLSCEGALLRRIRGGHNEDGEDGGYDGQSYSMRSLLTLLTRRLRRRMVASFWPAVTQLSFVEMHPSPKWSFLLWKASQGELRVKIPRRPQSWAKLLADARAEDVKDIPLRLMSHSDFLAMFLCVYPHRLRTDVVKLLDDALP